MFKRFTLLIPGAAILISVFNSHIAVAQQLTVGDFKKYCLAELSDNDDSAKSIEKLLCLQYVNGVTDGLSVANSLVKGPKLFCLASDGLEGNSIVKMSSDLLKVQKIPDVTPLRILIAGTLGRYFSCK